MRHLVIVKDFGFGLGILYSIDSARKSLTVHRCFFRNIGLGGVFGLGSSGQFIVRIAQHSQNLLRTDADSFKVRTSKQV